MTIQHWESFYKKLTDTVIILIRFCEQKSYF